MTGFSEDELSTLRSIFIVEAHEHLEVLQECLGRLRISAQDRGATEALKRELHTLKGAAGSVGWNDLQELSANIEDRLSAEPGPDPSAETISWIAAAVSDLETLLADKKRGPARSARDRRQQDRRGTDRRQGSSDTVRIEMRDLTAIVDAASQLVFDRNRIERRHQELLRSLYGLKDLERMVRRLGSDLHPMRDPNELTTRLSMLQSELDDAIFIFGHALEGANGDTETLRQTSSRLQKLIHGARSGPIQPLLDRVAATAGEIGTRANRPLEVEIVGGETAIDKVQQERLWQPLLHLVRNSIAHGIEPSDERAIAGKPMRGRLRLHASSDAEHVTVRIEDDGRGIDRERVAERLRHKGVALPEGAIDDATLFAELLGSGVSTQATVDDLAGRGVGLQIVREVLAELGGTVAIDSTPGVGTAFVLRLPVGTVVKEALLFKVGGHVYGLPAAAVLHISQIGPEQIERNPEGDHLDLDGERVPLLRLGALFGIPAPPADRQIRSAILLRGRRGSFALTCDKIIGPREVVVCSLGPLLQNLSLYAGATISGAGKVQLLLNLDTLESYALGRAPGPRPRRAHAAPRLLVVDDSRTVREAALGILQAAGFVVELAVDGQDALELLLDRPFDALITDLEMPRLDGGDLIARVRRSAGLRSLPIIVMSSRSSERTRANLLAVGATRLIGKPVRKRLLLEAVQSALRRATEAPAP